MPKTDEPFTVKKGLEIQEEDIRRWSFILTPKAIEALRAQQKKENAELDNRHTGYDVWRGDSITNWVCNHSYAARFDAAQHHLNPSRK